MVLLEPDPSQGRLKKVVEFDEGKTLPPCTRFDQFVSVVLIPSRGEYKKVGITNSLWFSAFDFSQFQAQASTEIRTLAHDEGIGARTARRKLYQPQRGEVDYIPQSESILPTEVRCYHRQGSSSIV